MIYYLIPVLVEFSISKSSHCINSSYQYGIIIVGLLITNKKNSGRIKKKLLDKDKLL
jgi:hypothetical protein